MNYLQNRDRLGAFLLLIFSLFYLRSAFHIPVDPFDAELGFTSKTLPIGLSACAIFVSTLLLFVPVSDRDSAGLADVVRHYRWKPTLALILLMGVYVAAFSYLGFVVASMLFLQAAFFVLGERRLLISVSVSVGLVAFLWIFLTQVFGLYLDKGALFSALVE